MPLPDTTDVSELIRFLRREHPEWPMKKVIAVAFSHARQVARKRGGRIPARLRRRG